MLSVNEGREKEVGKTSQVNFQTKIPIVLTSIYHFQLEYGIDENHPSERYPPSYQAVLTGGVVVVQLYIVILAVGVTLYTERVEGQSHH